MITVIVFKGFMHQRLVSIFDGECFVETRRLSPEMTSQMPPDVKAIVTTPGTHEITDEQREALIAHTYER